MRKVLWTPSRETMETSEIWKFMKFVNKRTKNSFASYDELYHWSISEPVKFWESIWDFFDIIGEKGNAFETAVPEFREMDWFKDAELNYTENMLRYMTGDTDALVFYAENKAERHISRNEVKRQVLSFAMALKDAGIQRGDIIAAYMPNMPETIIAMLGSAAIGAIWCSCATDVGSKVVIDRIGQLNPKLLVTSDGYYYKGKTFKTETNIQEVAKEIPSIENVIIVSLLGNNDYKLKTGYISWDDFINGYDPSGFHYERYPFSQPLVVMFSSGTTGKPKCMVQSAMGLLLNQLKEVGLHTDLTAKDRLLYITTCSWMMWNWMASAIGTGAALVLYDGNPSYPDNSAIWKIIEKENVTVFGLSASYVHMLMNQGFSPKNEVDLSSLREISQTGSALSDDGWEYVYREIKEDYFFNSIAGGTDINGCFAMANLLKPIVSSELQGPALGMPVDCLDDQGIPIRNTEGELVCRFCVPCMPLRFWNDPGNEKYYNAYFTVFEGLWRHGDYVLFHGDTNGISFCGRSDSVLKPSGVRIGTAEIYNQVEKLEEIEDSLAIGQNYNGDQRVILFLKLNSGYAYTPELEQKIKNTLRVNASPRHVPSLIYEVADIPITMNGKKVESAITNIMNGRDVTNRNALSNPDSLDIYIDIKKGQK